MMAKQHLKTTWNHIRRSPYQALAAVSIMFLTFFVASMMILVATGSQRILGYFETRPQVTAFFKDEVSQTEVDILKAKLAETGKINQTKYISKEEALMIYREQNKDDPLLLEMVTANILPASLEVSTTNITYLSEIAELLRNEPGVEEVIFQEDIVASLKTWTSTLRKVGIALISFLSLVSIMIILIIIGVKVSVKRNEIETLDLIGATKAFIRSPFVLEGIFYGVTGAFLAWIIAYLLLLYATPFLNEFLAGILVLPIPFMFMASLLGLEILVGILIGTLGSWLAVKRYLR